MTLEEALALLQPPPGHNTILNKEAIDVVCTAARQANPPTPTEWKLVPVEPTEEHIQKAADAFTATPDNLDTLGWIKRCYREMLSASPPAPAVAQDGVTDKREQIKAAVERMRAEDKLLMSMLTFDESCELAEAAIAPLLAENARLANDVKTASKLLKQHQWRFRRAEADANRLAEALHKLLTHKGAMIDLRRDALFALAEHDKLTPG